ncbi:hypothetical protein ONZ45_g12329 [Pleurotus djamor]|nr:hypothetical protein ONZ45_g12329 [Pleurotus djamor]
MPPPKKVISSVTIPSAPTRRIASAPAIPTLRGSGLPSTSLLFSTDSPTDSRPQSPDTPSVSTQTGASERTTRNESRGDGPPIAKRKRKPNQSDFLSNGPYRLRRPSDMRRAVSWRAPNSVQPLSKHSSKLASNSTISQRHTHEEPVTFNNPFASSAYPSPISRNNSLLMPLGSSDTEESSPEFNSPTFFEGGSQDTVDSVPEYDYGSSSSAIRAYYTSLADGSFGFQSPSPPKHD